MRSRSRLDAYIQGLQGRLRLGAALRGAAILTSAALVATVVLVLITNHFAFSSVSLTSARIALFVALAFTMGFGLAVPLYGLDRRRAVGKAETTFPEFQQRLVTFAEREQDGGNPFLDLLAADTMSIAERTEPKLLFSDAKLLGALSTGVVSLAVLGWMIMAGPGFLGHGASLLWLGSAHSGAPLYDLRVTPGDITVRRHADQIVNAQLIGLQPNQVRLYARYQSASKWDEVVMQPQQGASGYQFLFAGLPEGVEYYVEAGPLRSRHFNIRVADLPSIKQIRVTYNFPSWTGLPNAVEEHSGDLRAVEGTKADLEITTDRPLRDGVLVLDNNQQLNLAPGEGNVYKGAVQIQKDGLYYIAALDRGERVRLSEDYFIEAAEAIPPVVRIERPGRDYRATPIEEVTIAVNAAAEFGLRGVSLHYSVNGGPEQTVNLLKQSGAREANGSTVIYLEDYKLVPGDLVSMYAIAKDAHSESRTDMFFVQADPFEREFSQSQQMGGGGGGMGGMGGGGQEISERQKEIIAATWKQQGEKRVTAQQARETAKFLSDVQGKLRDQALSLAGRLERRELTEQNEEFSAFQKDMTAAAEAMAPASERLGQQKWKDAIPHEQKALQHLLRAEATFRRIEVAFGAGGGGGGGGGSAGRDLASLFDLELDTQKNQYEVGQTASSAEQRAQDIDEALKKLEELARRQQDLANQQRNSAQDFQQRWQQEMLRRDAEELQRQMEQLSRNGQQGNSGSASGQSGQSGSQGGAQGQGQGQGAGDPRTQQALDQLRQASEDMRRAASQSQSQADARRAAERLRQATDLLGGMQNQQASQRLDSIVREGDRLANAQRDQQDRLRQAFSNSSGSGTGRDQARYQDLSRLADERQRIGEDLARLQRQMQDTIRELASGQRPAATKLREALGGTQQSDLTSRLQRSADWIRRGINPNSNSGEPAIASDFGRLSDQLHQAQQALGSGGQQQGQQQQALDHVDRLRNQMEALSRGLGDRAARNGQAGQSGGQPGQGSQMDQGAQAGQGSNAGNGGGQVGSAYGNFGGNYGGGPYGSRERGAYGGFDRGGYVDPLGAERQVAPMSQADIDRAYQEAMRELSQLRQSVQGQPGPLSDIQDLMRELQRLDPKRFPGNPAMLDELHAQVLATVDRIELQLRRDLDSQNSGQIRSGDSLPVPSGYQSAVAEYFRRLSNKNAQ